jgi:ligand-binding sensor domain-containing protein
MNEKPASRRFFFIFDSQLNLFLLIIDSLIMKIKSTLLLFFWGIIFSYSQHESLEIDNNIRSIYQDKKGNYWFGTNGAGVFRFDGTTITQFTVTDGLADNQIQNIQEDPMGNIWFGTGLFGVSRFDGKTFTTFTYNEILLLNNQTENKSKSNDLWFYAGGGAFFLQDNKLIYLPIGK